LEKKFRAGDLNPTTFLPGYGLGHTTSLPVFK